MAYIPTKDAAFAVWVKSLLTYLQAHLTAFHIQDPVFQPPLNLNLAWEAACAKVLSPNRGKGPSFASYGRTARGEETLGPRW